MGIDPTSGLQATLARIREITGQVDQMSPTADFASALQTAQSVTSTSATTATTAATTASTPASSVTGQQLDAWMARKNPGSPLVGLGDAFVQEGRKNGIDPRALVAIARAESSLGTDPGAQARHNAFGWGPTQSFASWQDNIATVARGLKTGYLDDGLTTLAQIQARYAPLGVSNDPANLNSNWLRNTTSLYAELGGDPSGSVALAG